MAKKVQENQLLIDVIVAAAKYQGLHPYDIQTIKQACHNSSGNIADIINKAPDWDMDELYKILRERMAKSNK